jgi:hypothetical protein
VLPDVANHVGPGGADVPSVATLVRYTGMSERTVRACLDRLQPADIISPCNPDIARRGSNAPTGAFGSSG